MNQKNIKAFKPAISNLKFQENNQYKNKGSKKLERNLILQSSSGLADFTNITSHDLLVFEQRMDQIDLFSKTSMKLDKSYFDILKALSGIRRGTSEYLFSYYSSVVKLSERTGM